MQGPRGPSDAFSAFVESGTVPQFGGPVADLGLPFGTSGPVLAFANGVFHNNAATAAHMWCVLGADSDEVDSAEMWLAPSGEPHSTVTFALAGPGFSEFPSLIHFDCTFLGGTGPLNVTFEDVDILALQVETLTAP